MSFLTRFEISYEFVSQNKEECDVYPFHYRLAHQGKILDFLFLIPSLIQLTKCA